MKLKNLAQALVATSIFVSFYAGAVGKCTDCTITGIQADPRRSGTYIFLSGDWSESETSCSNTTITKAFVVPAGSPVESIVVSLGLAAFSAGRQIGWIFGNGNCDAFGYEEVDYMYVK